MGWIKKYWWVLLIAAVAILAPLIINGLILLNTPHCWIFGKGVVGDGTHWLGFWATYISAIASFAMVLITWYTLKHNKKQNELILQQNKEQLDELKRQWEENNRARLTFSIVRSEVWYMLKISNVGKETAFNIKVNFSEDYINLLQMKGWRETFRQLQARPFILEAGKSNYYTLSGAYQTDKITITHRDETITSHENSTWLALAQRTKLNIQGIYNDRYPINEEFSIDDFITGSSLVYDELTNNIRYIREGLISHKKDFLTIQNSLDIIAKKTEQ